MAQYCCVCSEDDSRDKNLNLLTNRDNITDFNASLDTIWLSKTIFTQLNQGAPLPTASLVVGPRALDANDFIIYNGFFIIGSI